MAVDTADKKHEDAPVDEALSVGGVLEFLSERATVQRLLLISDSPRVVGNILGEVSVPVILATTKDDIRKDYAEDCETVLRLTTTLPDTLEVLEDVRGILISAFLEGSLGNGDDVLCLVVGDSHPLVMLNFSLGQDPAFRILRSGIDERCDLDVFEMLLRIAGDLVREGREGKTVGTMFVIGDTDKVFEHSRQVVINPFQGHERGERNVLSPENIETIKEYANLDGAIVVTPDGYLEAAGRYILLEPDANTASGLGGRHLAAASITTRTQAIAIVVSASGIVRVYKDGNPEMELDGF